MPRGTARRTSKRPEPVLTALEQYRCVRDQLRESRGFRKQRELCDELDRLWWKLEANERKVLKKEFDAHERTSR